MQVEGASLLLQPARFITSFDLAAHSVLGSVGQLVCTEAKTLYPRLDSVRSYLLSCHRCRATPDDLCLQLSILAPGSCQQSSDGVPSEADLVGTLVVCLPFSHTGGKLTVQQAGKKVRGRLCSNKCAVCLFADRS